MKKQLLLLVMMLLPMVILLSSCQDNFIKEYQFAYYKAGNAFKECESFESAALEAAVAENLISSDYGEKYGRYLDEKKKCAQFMKDIDSKVFDLALAKGNNSKKEEACNLYSNLYYELNHLMERCDKLYKDTQSVELSDIRKRCDKIQGMLDKIKVKYIDDIEAGKNPFK